MTNDLENSMDLLEALAHAVARAAGPGIVEWRGINRLQSYPFR